jgi:hypothetical protein
LDRGPGRLKSTKPLAEQIHALNKFAPEPFSANSTNKGHRAAALEN